MNTSSIQLIECPRDAMQGWATPIPTAQKIEYINSLLQVGFHTIDFGSFVSPTAIPQMADTHEVLQGLSLKNTDTKLLAIVANVRGAEQAVGYDAINYIGFPFSISEIFQQKNTNRSIAEAFELVCSIQQLCQQYNKTLVVYLSMGFGNPYGEAYNETLVLDWANKMSSVGVPIISLADTVGLATPDQVLSTTRLLVDALPQTTIGVHLHSAESHWQEKVEASLEAGCRRFDGALRGIGGCPLSGNALVGNMNTERMVAYFQDRGWMDTLNQSALQQSLDLANRLFV